MLNPPMSRFLPILLLVCAGSIFPATAWGAVLRVGPDRPFKTVRAAANAVQDGDTVEVDGGTYSGDVATWRRNNVTVRAIGGRAHLRADGAYESGKGIWVVQGSNFTVEGMEFSGASVPDQNGAGIRAETTGTLTIRNCYFHDNENGILGPNDPAGILVIENSIFANNGYGDGYSHNIYIGPIASFTLRGSYSHKARIGHNVKSRARQNYILYNRIMDEDTGTASYQIDLPEGGLSVILGNIIQQGQMAENSSIIAYAAENTNSGRLELCVVNNTIVNDRDGGGLFLQIRSGTQAKVINNIFYGPGTAWSTAGVTVDASNNYREASHNNSPHLVDPQTYDYHISADSPCVNAGIPPGAVDGFGLTPQEQYVYDAQSAGRVAAGSIDIGAFEAAAGGTSRCDINLDSMTNVADVESLIRQILGISFQGNGDINRDGNINVLDLQVLVNVILGFAGCPG
jgi:hypothetical protein